MTGLTVEQLLAAELPAAVEGMTFPKTMRWGEQRRRWVRPVHWILALHGARGLSVELFGVTSSDTSAGHRFLSDGPVGVEHPDRYSEVLRAARVVIDPAERRRTLARLLQDSADELGGAPVEDPGLLAEVADLVEWPGVVAGRFDPAFLELPREVLVTTLRHHQKCFSVQDGEGELAPGFLAVANTDRDPAGHVRRGNEWVVGGRLEDARFFWREDRKRNLESRLDDLEGVVFHARSGSYLDKARRTSEVARALAERMGLSAAGQQFAGRAALLAKVDLVTALVGEFPELQGVAGGLLLREEGADVAVADGVYEHYRPTGPEDPVPDSEVGAIVSLADKLDTIGELLRAGERVSGSRDPFGIRRAGNGILRVLLERGLDVSLADLNAVAGGAEAREFLAERLPIFLRERGYTANEVGAMLRPRVSPADAESWPLADMQARLEAIRGVRDREDFRQLVKLTQRVDNILTKDEKALRAIVDQAGGVADWREPEPAARELATLVERAAPLMEEYAAARNYAAIVSGFADFVEPVERFFDTVLVVDRDDPVATAHRRELLACLRSLLTRYFDIRELAGQADRRG